MPLNFFIIITIQVFTYLLLTWKKKHLSFKEFYFSSIVGIILGFFFDITLSTLGIHTYIRDTELLIPNAWNLTSIELLCNGLLSYGIAVVTAKILAGTSTEIRGRSQRNFLIFFTTIFIVSIIAVFFSKHGTLLLASLCGLTIVACGECVLLLRKRTGPLTELMLGHNLSISLLLWLKIIAVGIVYESTNHFFPFWSWFPNIAYSHLILETGVIVFGYIVLLHPMIVWWRLRKEPKNT